MGIWLGDEAAKTDIHFASHWRKDLVQWTRMGFAGTPGTDGR